VVTLTGTDYLPAAGMDEAPRRRLLSSDRLYTLSLRKCASFHSASSPLLCYASTPATGGDEADTVHEQLSYAV